MIKLTLKRRISGEKIKKAERKKRLKEEREETFYQKRTIGWDKKIGKRQVENPNVYKGETPIVRGSFYAARLPKKKRKTAWKRFKKNFPHVKLSKYGTKEYVPIDPSEIKPLEPMLNPCPKKKIN